MAEYDYVKGQKKRIEKLNEHLMSEYAIMERKGHIRKMKEKYDLLVEKKKNKNADWMDKLMIKVYEDAMELEKKKKK